MRTCGELTQCENYEADIQVWLEALVNSVGVDCCAYKVGTTPFAIDGLVDTIAVINWSIFDGTATVFTTPVAPTATPTGNGVVGGTGLQPIFDLSALTQNPVTITVSAQDVFSHSDYQLGEFYYTSPTTAETPYSPLHDCVANEDLLKNAYVGDAKFTAEENVPATPYELFWIPADGVNDAPLAPALVESTVVDLVRQDERTATLTEKLVAKDYKPSKAGRVADIIQVLATEGLSIASRAKSGGAVKEVVEAPVEEVPIEKAPVEAVASKG